MKCNREKELRAWTGMDQENLRSIVMKNPLAKVCALLNRGRWIVLCLALFLSGLCDGVLHAESANSLYKQGESAEVHEDYDGAYEYYLKAYSMVPQDLLYRTALYRVKVSASAAHVHNGRKLLDAGDDKGALAQFLRAIEIDPGNEAAHQEIARIRTQEKAPKHSETVTKSAESSDDLAEVSSLRSPVQLKPMSNEPLTLHMVEDAKVVYAAVGKAAGINVLFDPDYVSKRIQVDLNSVSLLDALEILGTVSNTFWRPITLNTIFVAQNSRVKQTELQQQAVKTFYLTNAWQQNDLNDIQTAVRNVLPNAKVYGVASQSALVMRGTPDEVLLAQKIIDDLDKARPEVVVDISILEVSKNWERTLGIEWPSSVGVGLQNPTSTSTSSSSGSSGSSTSSSCGTSGNCSLSTLANLNSNNLGVTISAAQANLLLTNSNTKVLDNPRIRCTDQQKAIMKIGQRVPIATGSFQAGVSAAPVSSLVNTQFQYQDVGVNIELTPTIHHDDDVTLKVKIDDSSEGTPVTISGIQEPIFIQKTSEQVVRLREGEASVMSGMVNQTDTTSWAGIPGLSSIPLLRYLFGSKDHTINSDEIVFLIVPHVVRSEEITPVNMRTIDTGTGQGIELHRMSAQSERLEPGTNQPGVAEAAGQETEDNRSTRLPPAAAGTQNQGSTRERMSGATNPNHSQPLRFELFNPLLESVTVGTTFQVPVILTGADDVVGVPFRIQYDASRLSLVDVEDGDLFNRDKHVATLAHRDDGQGTLEVAVSRAPHSSGVSGSGVVCVLTFQAKAKGKDVILIPSSSAVNGAHQQLPAEGTRIKVAIR